MSEKEILDKIEKSAAQEKIPESIEPEQIKRKLKENQKNKVKRRSGITYYGAVAAAALVLVIGAAGGIHAVTGGGTGLMTAPVGIEKAASGQKSDEGSEGSSELKDGATAGVEKNAQKKDAGSLYTVAKNYGEVYDAICSGSGQEKEADGIAVAEGENSSSGDVTTYIMGDTADTADTAGAVVDGVEDIGSTQMIKGAGAQSGKETADVSSDTAEQQYSGTNLQTQGVDESDFVKTDGSYIYTVSHNEILITDIRKKALKQIGKIQISETSSDRVLEMYVDGDILSVIVESEDSGLEMQADDTENYTEDCFYYFSERTQTQVLTYDISDPEKPVKTGCVTQDGRYQTSRKIGNIIYLFTNKRISMPQQTKEEAVTEENVSGWIPLVNDNAVDAEDIYVDNGGGGSNSLLISSVNVKNPDQVVDNTMILSQYVDIYVSESAFYAYQIKGSWNDAVTQIAKFGLADGKMDADGAVSVNGRITDTFAINEQSGKLRVLTTSQDSVNGEDTNNLYLFDKNLSLTGKIEGLAQGEEIYAARYLGNMAYFVTYRNTDPLFAVDLSDDKNPKVLGELKISGFSEYLHFWGEDKLIGIGYETDEKTGEHTGIKITMFDISDPADLKEVESLVLKDYNYSEALYNYKCVLADADENLLGFALQSYGDGESVTYLLLTWNGEKFETLLSQSVTDKAGNPDQSKAADTSAYRGIYAGDMFYIVSTEKIISYDRTQEYCMQKSIDFK
jgi:inhibitor of cysteine peptidase